jgi:beta-amyrin synthase
MPADIVRDTIEVEQLYEAVDFLLTLQVILSALDLSC